MNDAAAQVSGAGLAEFRPLPGFLGRLPPLRSLGYPAFRWVVLSLLMSAAASSMHVVVVGWYVYQQTQSPFLTAATFAVRSVPRLLFSPVGGALSDRLDRRYALIVPLSLRAVVYASFAAYAFSSATSVWPIFLLVFLGGAASPLWTPASQALITDAVERKDAMNAISLNGTVSGSVAVVGFALGGVLLEHLHTGWVLLAGVGLLGPAVLTLAFMRTPPRLTRAHEQSAVASVVSGVRTLSGIPVVALLLCLAVVVEILGFASSGLLPAVAVERLAVGSAGLGALGSMEAVGEVAGVALLATLGDYRYKGLLIIGLTAGFGVSIVALGASTTFALSMVIMFAVGAVAGMFDALQFTLLQANVPSAMRGRVIASWNFATGFGWVGFLAIGALAQNLGVQWALAATGVALVAVAFGVLLFGRRLRGA
jgi:MFS family permease